MPDKIETLLERLKRLIRPYAPRVMAAIVASLLVSGLNGAIAWFVKPAMDYIFIEKREDLIVWLPFGVMLLFILRGSASFLQAYLMRTAGFKLVRDTRNSFFKSLVNMPVHVASGITSGDMISRLMNDINLLSVILADCFKTFLLQIPTIVVLVAIAFYRKWDLALMSFLLLPMIAWGTKILSGRIKKRRRKVQEYLSMLTHRMAEAASGLKVIKIFGMERLKVKQFMDENHSCYRQLARVVKLREGTKLITELGAGLAVSIILGYGASMVTRGDMTPGDFFSILTAIAMVFSPIKKTGTAYSKLQESLAVIERIDQFIDTPPERGGSIRIDGLEKGVSFQGVTFSYGKGEAPALRDISLEIPRGGVVAIVGPSGAGKTTLSDLVPCFHTVEQGRILWDGIDVRDIDIHSLRRQIGIVSQDVVLFSDSIKMNIAAARPDATDEEIVRAARSAYADQFIRSMPHGYDTMLNERGMNLSGGQRQRIALARAVLKNPPLLILDEATSALDTVSEQEVQRALEEVMRDRTTVVIAHRLSTIQHADMIVVLDNGRIVSKGTHEELLEGSELYQELYLTLKGA
jgi:subfamily B ATP-binding cassette protein MsbA